MCSQLMEKVNLFMFSADLSIPNKRTQPPGTNRVNWNMVTNNEIIIKGCVIVKLRCITQYEKEMQGQKK